MREIRIDKVTLNIGAGKEQSKIEKALVLLKRIGSGNPVKTFTNKRIPEWGLRPGLPIGVKLTIRGEKANALLANLLKACDSNLAFNNFDNEGNVSFGIAEYIDVPGMKYDPDIGIIGFQASVTLHRAGFRIKNRKVKKMSIPAKHRIARVDAIEFMKDKFNITVAESAEE